MPKGKEFGAEFVERLYRKILTDTATARFPDAWRETKEAFADVIRKSGKIVDVGQTWKTSSGKAFEKIASDAVLKILDNARFKDMGIEGKRWSELSEIQRRSLSTYLERRCTGKQIPLSNEPDIVIYSGSKPRIILSCKSSLRDRVNMDLFWAEVNRRAGRIFIVVSAETSESIGTHDKPKKPRLIAECLYDRLYIINGETDYCDVVRPFVDFETDLTAWLG